jgi:hypothetical protein
MPSSYGQARARADSAFYLRLALKCQERLAAAPDNGMTDAEIRETRKNLEFALEHAARLEQAGQ